MAPARRGRDARAIVVGSGMSGLLAARVLGAHVGEVVLVDRDHPPSGSEPRAGIPQGHHVHVLLGRGARLLERLFPGLTAELDAAGATPVDITHDILVITPGGTSPRWRSGVMTRAASRYLLESRVRARVAARSNVRVLDDHEAVGVLVDPAGAVVGVRLRRRGSVGAPEVLEPADLVVDASGRSSRAPEWLVATGLPAPDESVIDASLAYATRLYRRPSGWSDWRVLLVRDRAPHGTRGGVVFPVEGGRWLVTLGGAGDDRPPTDEAGFETFARSLISPVLADALRVAEPLGSVRGYARTANRWRHVERLSPWPAGLLVLGDAMCALNPVYGQGMSVAAIEAVALDGWLRAGEGFDGASTGRMQRRLASAARLPWLMATSEDHRLPHVGTERASLLERVAGRYLDEVQRVAPRDRPTTQALTMASHLLARPRVLVAPRVLGAVARSALVGGRRAGHRPG